MLDIANDFSNYKEVIIIIWIIFAIIMVKRQASLTQATLGKDEFIVYHTTWYPWLFMLIMLMLIVCSTVDGFDNFDNEELAYQVFMGFEILVCVFILSISYWKLSVKDKEITYYSLFNKGGKTITFDMIKRAEHKIPYVHESDDYLFSDLVLYSSDDKILLSVPTGCSDCSMLLKQMKEYGVKIIETRKFGW